MLFQMHKHPFLWRNHIQALGTARPIQIVYVFRNGPPESKIKPHFLGVINYLNKYTPATSQICKQLGSLQWNLNGPVSRHTRKLYD